MREHSVIRRKAAIISNNIHCGRHVQYFSTLEKYFRINGWVISDDFNVDKIVICSCGFHDAMYDKVQRTLEGIRKTGFLEKNIIIMACLTRTHQERLEASFKGEIITFHEEAALDRAIQATVPYADIPPVNCFNVHKKCESGPLKKDEKFHIKISEGCLKRCTFCVINKAKGYIKSIPFPVIETQVRKAIELGRKKIHLMGEDTFAYGIDQDSTVLELIKKIKAIGPDLQLSFGYLHSHWLSQYGEDIVALCKEGVIRELQVGFQHVNEKLLKRMGRPIQFDPVYDLLCKIKKENPDFYMIVDILVGFPGETEEMFTELLEFFKNDRCFNKVKHFAYSDVKGAPSYNFKDKLSQEVIAARWQQLDDILGPRSYSSENDEARIDNETFRQTRFDDYFFCKDSFDEPVEESSVAEVSLAEPQILKEDSGEFGF